MGEKCECRNPLCQHEAGECRNEWDLEFLGVRLCRKCWNDES
jgi:hypothetical protein